jgi:hypothetical protein
MGIDSPYWYSYRPARRRAWSIRMLASAVSPATLQAACEHSLYVFSELCKNRFFVYFYGGFCIH